MFQTWKIVVFLPDASCLLSPGKPSSQHLCVKGAVDLTQNSSAAVYLCVGIFLLERRGWLFYKGLDISPLEDLIVFLCLTELHIDFRSPAP